jgi:dihydroorotate dehydrogenase
MTPALASSLMPLMRLMDPETAHTLALRALRAGLAGRAAVPALPVEAMGLSFRNPLGLAAGFDKNAVAARPLFALGFGFVEVGTITPRPQAGNPRPRLFRLAEDGAVINRMGMNNVGWEAVSARIAAMRAEGPLPGPLGVNVGINKDCDDPVRDTGLLVEGAARVGDYVTVNVSSPNTPGLRDLQAADRLAALLEASRQGLARAGRTIPVVVKIAPDLHHDALGPIIETALGAGVSGLIVSNTTIARPDTLRSRHRGETGGLSGRPLFAPATAMLRAAARIAAGRLVLIGAGGVASGADAYAKIRAGASLVQLYSAMAYAGPALPARILAELAALLARDGFRRVEEAVGLDREHDDG